MPFSKKKPGKGKGQREKEKNQDVVQISQEHHNIEKQDNQNGIILEINGESNQNGQNMKISPSKTINIPVLIDSENITESKHEGVILQDIIKPEEQVCSFEDTNLLKDGSFSHQKNQGQIQFQKGNQDCLIEINTAESNGISPQPQKSSNNWINSSQILQSESAIQLESFLTITSKDNLNSPAAAASESLLSKRQCRITRSSVNTINGDPNISNTYEMLSYSRERPKRGGANPGNTMNGSDQNKLPSVKTPTFVITKDNLAIPSWFKIFEGATWTNRTGQKKKSGVYPAKRWGHTAVVFEKYMYVYGGCGKQADSIKTSQVFRLDCEIFEWEQLVVPENSQQPQARDSHSASVIGTQMWVFGGSNYETLLNEFWRFDLISHGWVDETQNIVGSMPSAREGHSVAVLHDRYLAIIGGFESTKEIILRDIYLLDTVSMKCSNIGQTTWPPRESASASVIGDSIYLFGGQGSKDNQYFNDLYHIYINDIDSDNPSIMMNLVKISDDEVQPTRRSSHQQVSFQNRFIIVLGGETSVNDQKEITLKGAKENTDEGDNKQIIQGDGSALETIHGISRNGEGIKSKLMDFNNITISKLFNESMVNAQENSKQQRNAITKKDEEERDLNIKDQGQTQNQNPNSHVSEILNSNDSSNPSNIPANQANISEDLKSKQITEPEVDSLSDVWVFDTRQCIWRELQAKSSKNGFKGRFNFSVSLLKDKLIAFGGTQSQEHLLEDIMVLSLREETSMLPEKSNNHCPAVSYALPDEKQNFFLDGVLLKNETLEELRKKDLKEQLLKNGQIKEKYQLNKKMLEQQEKNAFKTGVKISSPFEVILGMVDAFFQLSSRVNMQYQGQQDLNIEIPGIDLGISQFKMFINYIKEEFEIDQQVTRGHQSDVKGKINQPSQIQKAFNEDEFCTEEDDSNSILGNKLKNLAKALQIGVARLGKSIEIISQNRSIVQKAKVEYWNLQDNSIISDGRIDIKNDNISSCKLEVEEIRQLGEQQSEKLIVIINLKRTNNELLLDEDSQDIVLRINDYADDYQNLENGTINEEHQNQLEKIDNNEILKTILHNSLDYSFMKFASLYYYQPVSTDKLYLNDQLVEFKSYIEVLQSDATLENYLNFKESQLDQRFCRFSFFIKKQQLKSSYPPDLFQNGCLVYSKNRLTSRFKGLSCFGQSGIRHIQQCVSQGKVPYDIHGALILREKNDKDLNNYQENDSKIDWRKRLCAMRGAQYFELLKTNLDLKEIPYKKVKQTQ